jgi:hypothetical protein
MHYRSSGARDGITRNDGAVFSGTGKWYDGYQLMRGEEITVYDADAVRRFYK